MIGVIWAHAIPWYLAPDRLNLAGFIDYRIRHPIVSNGHLGVNVFFILSGFVLALPYLDGRRSFSEPGALRTFYRRRAERLLPLYYVAMFVGMFVRVESDYTSFGFVKELFLLATFGYTFFQVYFFPRFDMAMWSLAIEFWFSAMFPLILVGMKRRGFLVLWLLVPCLLVRIYGASLFPDQQTPLNHVKDGIFGRLDDFVVGMVLCLIVTRQPSRSRVASFALLGAGFAVFGILCVAWNAVTLRQVPFSVTPYLHTLTQLGTGLLLLGLVGDLPTPVRFVFTAWPIQLVGMMCYSIYVWHPMGQLGSAWSRSALPVYLAFIFTLAALSYRFIEFPRRSFRDLFMSYPK